MKKPPSLSSVVKPATAPAPHVIEAHEAVNGPSLVRLSINLPSDVHRQLKLKATAEGRSLRDVVIELVGEYVRR